MGRLKRIEEGRYLNKNGEVRLYIGRERGKSIIKQESRVLVERLLGVPLPAGSEIHHIDENPSNNTITNLVICKTRKEHDILHVRIRALKACGHADWRKCCYCKEYDDTANMYNRANETGAYHRECLNEYRRNRKRRLTCAN